MQGKRDLVWELCKVETFTYLRRNWKKEKQCEEDVEKKNNEDEDNRKRLVSVTLRTKRGSVKLRRRKKKTTPVEPLQRLIPDPLLDWTGLDCFPFTSLYHVMCVCSVGSVFPCPARRKNGLSFPSFLLSSAWDERLLGKCNLVFGNCFFSFSNFYRVFLAVCDPLFLDRNSKSISFTLITSTGQ